MSNVLNFVYSKCPIITACLTQNWVQIFKSLNTSKIKACAWCTKQRDEKHETQERSYLVLVLNCTVFQEIFHNHKPSRNLTEISEISKVSKFVLFQRSPTTYWFLHEETGVEQSSIDENICSPRHSLVQWESGEGGDICIKCSSVRHGIVKKASFRWEHCMLHLLHKNLVTEFENRMNYCVSMQPKSNQPMSGCNLLALHSGGTPQERLTAFALKWGGLHPSKRLTMDLIIVWLTTFIQIMSGHSCWISVKFTDVCPKLWKSLIYLISRICVEVWFLEGLLSWSFFVLSLQMSEK